MKKKIKKNGYMFVLIDSLILNLFSWILILNDEIILYKSKIEKWHKMMSDGVFI